MTELAVTGLGFVSAWGCDEAAVFAAFEGGLDACRRLPADDPRRHGRVDPAAVPDTDLRAGWVTGFEPALAIEPGRLRRMDFVSRMLVTAAGAALADAGLRRDAVPARDRVGLAIGSRLGDQRETAAYLDRILERGSGAGQPFLFPNLVLNAAPGQVAIEFGLSGPCLAVSLAEASGEAALAAACGLLAAGRCDVVIAGGVDELSLPLIDLLAMQGLLAPDVGATNRVRKRSKGQLVPGEGAACLVLERHEDARRRRARVRAGIASATTHGVPAAPWDFGKADAIARIFAGCPDSLESIALVVAGPRGLETRRRAEELLLEQLAARRGTAPALVRPREGYGDFGACGALDTALACLAASRGRLPASSGRSDPLAPGERILVTGCGRAGSVAPVLVEVPATA